MSITDEKYVAFTTYRQNGDAKTTPVWIVDLGDGTIGFTTPRTSWKAKRLSNDGRVQIQPSDARGNPKEGTQAVDGTAVVVEGADFERIRDQIMAKYGWQGKAVGLLAKAFALVGKTGRVSNSGVIITLD